MRLKFVPEKRLFGNEPSIAPSELLHYLAQHKVLICLECHYAIQRGALVRHLKEIHKLRGIHRRPYLEYTSELDLDDSHDVLNTPILDFPIPLLPVLDGYACRHERCEYLSVSEKKMKQHWAACHGNIAPASRIWEHALLQTFFRGSLLQYFTDPWVRMPHHNLYDGIITASPSMDEQDRFLLRHYITYTSITIATDLVTRDLWQKVIPSLSLHSPFLLHGLLACASLHLVHTKHLQCQSSDYMIKAISHHDQAMPLFRSAITAPNDSNCSAILAFSHLLIIYSFALELNDEHLLLAKRSSLDPMPSWLYFVRNGCVMLCNFWDKLSEGPVQALVSAWEPPITNASATRQLQWTSHLLSLASDVQFKIGEEWSNDVYQIYKEEAESLAQAFASTEALEGSLIIWDVLRIWPISISDAFIDLLRASHPAALILLAHYCVLLQRVECCWYLSGRAQSLMANIVAQLDEKWHVCIRSPLNLIRAQQKELLEF